MHIRHSRKHSTDGFTLVELLIVIVIIAILAVITIVAYNGIQQRAQTSAVTGALSQVSQSLGVYQTTNGNYPPDLASANVPSNSNVSYQYAYDNTANPQTYCVTATSGTTSYKISSTAQQPSAGGCPGHGVGGQSAVTNLVVNPSVETGTSGWNIGSWGTGGAGTTTSSSVGGAASGNNYFRLTYTTGPTSGQPYVTYNNAPVTPGTSYCFSGALRPSWSGASFDTVLQWRDSGGVWLSGVSAPGGSSTAGSWTRYSNCGTAPANSASVLLLMRLKSGSTYPPTGATLDWDALILTQGSTSYNYADGSSPNWIWNGTANASTSTGPAL